MNLTLENTPRLTLGLALGFGFLFFYTLIQGLSTWHTDWKLIHHTTATITIKQTDAAALPKLVADNHLFGQVLTPDGDVPVTNLELRVTGITKVLNESGEDVSRASISIASAPDKTYQVGDALPDGVKIVGIESNAVILQNAGHLEKLPLPRSELQFMPRPSLGALS